MVSARFCRPTDTPLDGLDEEGSSLVSGPLPPDRCIQRRGSSFVHQASGGRGGVRLLPYTGVEAGGRDDTTLIFGLVGMLSCILRPIDEGHKPAKNNPATAGTPTPRISHTGSAPRGHGEGRHAAPG